VFFLPVEISKDHLEKFKDLYQKEFGKKATDEEALKSALLLLQLVKATYREDA
jgi:hypothetical protein